MLKVTMPAHPQRHRTRKRSRPACCARVGRQRHVGSITCDERGTSTSFAARRRPTHCHCATAGEHGHASHPEAASAVQRPTPPPRATLSTVVSSGSAMRHHATQLETEYHEQSRRGRYPAPSIDVTSAQPSHVATTVLAIPSHDVTSRRVRADLHVLAVTLSTAASTSKHPRPRAPSPPPRVGRVAVTAIAAPSSTSQRARKRLNRKTLPLLQRAHHSAYDVLPPPPPASAKPRTAT